MKLFDADMQGVPNAPAAHARGLAARLAVVICMTVVLTSAASARGFGGHHFSGGGAVVNSRFAAGHRHGNDSYVKAASQERDRLLKKLKDICRGC